MRCSGWRAAIMALVLLCIPMLPGSLRAQGAEDSCVTCHAALDDARLADPVQNFKADIHAAKGFGCVSCHGGDSQELGMNAMDEARGYIGIPERREQITVCGRCHSDAQFMRRYRPSLRVDQVAEYWTSEHGRLLEARDDARVATCASCHPAHSIKPPADPTSSVHPARVADTCGACHNDAEYMAPYGIATTQYEEYHKSVHWERLDGGDISAPTCNDCHGNHGAAPPGISWVGNVCGQCHSVMADLFNKSFHSQVLAMLGVPGCATCHSNHDVERAGDELLGVGEGASCAMCHTADSQGGKVAVEMRSLIDSLSLAFASADSILTRAQQAGMEVSEAQFDLNEALTALVSARTGVHGFEVAGVRAEVDTGLVVSRRAYTRGEEALHELQIRRLGLAISVIIIVGVITGLVLKIRHLER